MALSVSLVLVVGAETLGAFDGTGCFIEVSQETFLVPQAYAGVVLLGVGRRLPRRGAVRASMGEGHGRTA